MGGFFQMQNKVKHRTGSSAKAFFGQSKVKELGSKREIQEIQLMRLQILTQQLKPVKLSWQREDN